MQKLYLKEANNQLEELIKTVSNFACFNLSSINRFSVSIISGLSISEFSED
ncbi:hypothetical protein [Aphanothece sacrum]|uniref:Uncharacterized protein n=1 Tax=Aphanothece sacrum FPU1 TaxID=1920663 RepID=A0A401IMH9_APHSA|nr:hypothetical protein [Aphanothece sacrum]GBF82445.1 hypothetical protein AsFPU1_3874 [Aphanothece sacrum FPU1]GBF84400.1 hypothetical protein AsFPU3_1449 [Aphanothece sacrum FPU3]